MRWMGRKGPRVESGRAIWRWLCKSGKETALEWERWHWRWKETDGFQKYSGSNTDKPCDGSEKSGGWKRHQRCSWGSALSYQAESTEGEMGSFRMIPSWVLDVLCQGYPQATDVSTNSNGSLSHFRHSKYGYRTKGIIFYETRLYISKWGFYFEERCIMPTTLSLFKTHLGFLHKKYVWKPFCSFCITSPGFKGCFPSAP